MYAYSGRSADALAKARVVSNKTAARWYRKFSLVKVAEYDVDDADRKAGRLDEDDEFAEDEFDDDVEEVKVEERVDEKEEDGDDVVDGAAVCVDVRSLVRPVVARCDEDPKQRTPLRPADEWSAARCMVVVASLDIEMAA